MMDIQRYNPERNSSECDGCCEYRCSPVMMPYSEGDYVRYGAVAELLSDAELGALIKRIICERGYFTLCRYDHASGKNYSIAFYGEPFIYGDTPEEAIRVALGGDGTRGGE